MSVVSSLKKTFAEDLFRIFPLLSSNLRFRTVGVFFLMFAQSVLELGFIYVLANMGLALTDSAALRTSFLYEILFSLFPHLHSWAEDPRYLLVLAGGVVIIVSAMKGIVSYIAAYKVALLGEDMALDVGRDIMSRYLYRDYSWHLSSESSNVYQVMLWRNQLGLMLSTLLMMYATALTVLLLFVSLVGQEPLLTTLVVSSTVIIAIIFFKKIRRKVDVSAKAMADCALEETKVFLCATKGIREVLIYRQQETFLNSLVGCVLKGRNPRTFNLVAPTTPTWFLETVGFVAVISAIAYLIFYENAPIERVSAALGLLVLTAWRVLPYCNRIVSLQIMIRSIRPMASSVIDMLEGLRTLAPMQKIEADTSFFFHQEMYLENVSFRYAEAKTDCLKNICLRIKKGEKIGLIGASGGGKSTLVGVLSGLLPPSSGSISVDGQELTPSKAVALSAQIGYVPQSPFLFAGSLAENIAFSDWGKPYDAGKVKKACKQAAIDFVEAHPHGFERPIGDNGAGLSGGQAQRVSIARALYTDPSILIFDEATSALDQHNEKAIQQTIESLAENITCIIIAHRLSTVEKCDRLIWVENGEIVMDGVAKEVLAAYGKKTDM